MLFFKCILFIFTHGGYLANAYLVRIEKPRYRVVVARPAGDEQSAFVNAGGIFGEYPLSGRKNAAAEKPPLPAVRVTGYDQIDIQIAQMFRKVFRMVRKQYLESAEF